MNRALRAWPGTGAICWKRCWPIRNSASVNCRLLEATEQQNLLDSLGVEPGEHRLDQCIHHLFSEQALVRKDAPR